MPTARRVLLLLAALLLPGGGTAPVWGQPTTGAAVLARFQEAKALALDPTGRLYVADAGQDVVRIFDRRGTEQAALGGPGTRAGEFDGPADLDPTNGQALLVADAGNGRVQRFSAEWQYLEALPVGRTGGSFQRRAFDDARDGAGVQGSGRPIAVATSDGGDLFVIDGRSDVVLTFNAQRRPERIIGPAAHLQAPVALAVGDNRRLYVADAEKMAVFVYDLFGSYVERLPLPDLPVPHALTMQRNRLWVVCANRIVTWNPTTRTAKEHPVASDRPLLDAARWKGEVVLLTGRRLWRQSGWGRQ